MTNEEAIAALDEFVEAAGAAVKAGVWASAFVTFGGEATWDSLKSVSSAADRLQAASEPVSLLVARFEEILP